MSVDGYFNKKPLDLRMPRQEDGDPTGIHWQSDVLQGRLGVREAILRAGLTVRTISPNGPQSGRTMKSDPVLEISPAARVRLGSKELIRP